MDLPLYHAMTAAEFSSVQKLPKNIAWMACHFSAYSTSLSNLPAEIPAGSMIIINDKMPPSGHDKFAIAEQLNRLADRHKVSYFLLDFERKETEETAEMVQHLTSALNRQVAVTESYAHAGKGPVLISMPPPHISLKQQIGKIQNRELWLELAMETEIATIDSNGCHFSSYCGEEFPEKEFTDSALHTKYRLQICNNHAKYLLKREIAEVADIMKEAKNLGITAFVGLYQQLGKTFSEHTAYEITDG